MAVAINNRWIQAVATASQTVFNYDFIINNNTEIIILWTQISTGTVTTLSYGTDYTLTGIGVSAGGTFILNSGATVGDIYTAYGATPEARNSDFSGKAAVTTAAINSQYDNLTEQNQQLRRDIGRAIVVPISDNITSDSLTLPSVDNRKDKFAYFDDNGNIIAVEGTPASEAAGSNSQIQYNDNGTMAGDSGMTTNGSGVVSITGNLTVGNININTNTISSANSNGNIILDPNGTGKIVINSTIGIDGVIDDDTFATASASTIPTSESVKAYVDASPSGDFDGPASSTDNALIRFDGTTGKIGQNSGVIVDDSNVVTGITSLDVDNIRIDGNSILSIDTNGNIVLDPNGSGKVVINSSIGIDGVIDDDTFATASATTVPTSESVKAYIDTSATGDVKGPASATDNAVARYDTTTGKLIQDSLIIIDDGANASGFNNVQTNNVQFKNASKILDTNTLPLIEFSASGAAVNYLNIGNQTAGNSPKISAIGTDTNVSLQLQSKGTGDLKVSSNSILVDNGSTGAGEIRLREITTNGSEYIGLKAPDSLSGNTTFILPPADGSAAQVLKTDGSGNLGWASVATTPGTSVDNTIPKFDGTAGAIQDTGIVVDDSNNISGQNSIAFADSKSIVDENSNNQIKFHTTVTAVNNLGIKNNIAGKGPILSAEGTDTDIILGLNPKGIGWVEVSSTNASGSIVLIENPTNGSNFIGFKAPDSVASNVVFTLPDADGTAGQILKTDGSKNLSWITNVGVTDGDKGDIVVSSSGTVWNIDSTVATTAGRAIMAGADASAQRTTLGLGTISTQDASNVTITGGSVTGITDLAIADGGTGASTAVNARTNLGLVIGTDVQAYDAELAAIAGLTSAADKGIQFTGIGTAGTFDLTTAGKALLADADASAQRITLGLGTIATQDSNSVSITGGSITGITDLAVADGGTGSSTASGARTNLGLAIGTDVQAYNAKLTDIASHYTAATTTVGSSLAFVEGTNNGTNKVVLKSGDSLSADVTFTLPLADGSLGQVLKTDGSGNLGWENAATGSVTGPGSSTDTAIARFNGTGGSTIENSGVLIDSSNVITGSKLITIGDNSSGPGEVRFNNTAGTHYVGLKAGTLSADKSWVLPTADGTSGQAIVTDGSGNLSFSSIIVSANVVGPVSSTDTAIARFNGTTGELIENSGVLIDGSNNISGANSLAFANGKAITNGTENYLSFHTSGTPTSYIDIAVSNAVDPTIASLGSGSNYALNLNSKGTGNVAVTCNSLTVSNGASGPGNVTFYGTSNTNNIIVKAPASPGGSSTITLPVAASGLSGPGVLVSRALDGVLAYYQPYTTFASRQTASSSAQLDFVGIIPNVTNCLGAHFILRNITMASTGTFLVRLGNVSGTFDTGTNYQWHVSQSTMAATPTITNQGSNAASNMRIGQTQDTTTADALFGTVTVISDFTTSAFTRVFFQLNSGNGTVIATQFGTGYYSGGSIGSVRFFGSAGNLSAGTIDGYTLYGGSTSSTF